MIFTSLSAQASLATIPHPSPLPCILSNNRRAWLLSALFLLGLTGQDVDTTLFKAKLNRVQLLKIESGL